MKEKFLSRTFGRRKIVSAAKTEPVDSPETLPIPDRRQKTVRLLVETTVRENYGTAAKPYWKTKPGEVYLVANLTWEKVVELGSEGLQDLIRAQMDRIFRLSSFVQETLADWYVTDTISSYEKLQIEWAGKIYNPPVDLTVPQPDQAVA